MSARVKTCLPYLSEEQALAEVEARSAPRSAAARISDRGSNEVADALLTVADVAELLRVPVSWVYERTRTRSANRIPGFRLGKYWRFRKSDVSAWLDRQDAGVKASA